MNEKRIQAICVCNTILLLIVFISNIIRYIIYNGNYVSYIYNIVILFFFLSLSIYTLITKNEIFITFLYLLAGITTILLGKSDNLSAIIFAILALSFSKSNTSLYIVISSLSSALICRVFYIKADILESINIITVHIGICILYYLITSKRWTKENDKGNK